MKKLYYSILFVFLLTGCGCSTSRNENTASTAGEAFTPQYPYVLDVTADYTLKNMRLQDYADVTYIPLETKEGVLLGEMSTRWYGIADDCVFVRDIDRIYRFSLEGKFLNTIGIPGRGPSEYIQMDRIDIRPEVREIFIYDLLPNKVLVYDFEGRYVRGFGTPADFSLGDMASMDDSTLLYVVDDHVWGGDSGNGVTHMLSDSRAGKVGERFGLHSPDSYRPYRKPMGNGIMELVSPIRSIIPVPGGVMLNDINCDTVYAFDARTRDFDPRYLLQPREKVNYGFGSAMASLQFETPRYAFFVVSTMDFGNMPVKGYCIDKKTGSTVCGWLLDDNIYGGEAASLPVKGMKVPRRLINTFAATGSDGRTILRLLDSAELLEALEEGRLTGPLKTIAKQLDEEDNPVLAVVRFRE